jgi:hypothetical protein
MRETTKSFVSGGVFARETMPVGLGILAGAGEKGWIVNRYWLLLSGGKGKGVDCQQVWLMLSGVK